MWQKLKELVSSPIDVEMPDEDCHRVQGYPVGVRPWDQKYHAQSPAPSEYKMVSSLPKVQDEALTNIDKVLRAFNK